MRMISGGCRLVCIREVQNSIKDSVKQLLEDKIEAHGLSGAFTITEREIRGQNGSLAIFRGMQNHTAASIKSLEGFDVAWVEEAQTLSQKSLDLLTPTIRKPGSEIWASWNPDEESDPIESLLRHDPPDNAIVVEANWTENPWFPDELREDMERDRRRDPDKFQHIWGGGYQTRSEARIFRNWRVGELVVPQGVRWWYGADWGFANDPTAAVRCAIWDGKLYVDHEAVEVGCPIERTPTLLKQIPEFARWPSRADSARPETIDYCRRNGIPKMRAARKGKNSVRDGIEWLRGFDIVIHPRCVHLDRELTLYGYKVDKHTGEILPDVEDAHNHCVDALRYATEGLHKRTMKETKAPVEYTGRVYGGDEGESNWKTL